MANQITEETIEYVSILAKLELSGEEKEQARKDMGNMLEYIDRLGELDTTDVEPLSHVFPLRNVFREDVVTNGDGSRVTQQTELRVEEHVKLVDLDSEDAGEDVVAKLVYDDKKGQGDYKLESFYDK